MDSNLRAATLAPASSKVLVSHTLKWCCGFGLLLTACSRPNAGEAISPTRGSELAATTDAPSGPSFELSTRICGLRDAWRQVSLASLGESEAGEVFGVIGEYAVEGGMYVLVAGYADGTSRLLVAAGPEQMGPELLDGSAPHDEPTARAARALVQAAARNLAVFAPEVAPWTPRAGYARVTVLTSGGRRVWEGLRSEFEQARPPTDGFSTAFAELSSALTDRYSAVTRASDGGVEAGGPRDPTSIFELSAKLLVAEEYVGALEVLDVVAEPLAEHPAYHHNRGLALQGLRRHAEAVKCFERAIALAPTVASHRVALGWNLLLAGRASEALAAFDEGLRLGGEVEATESGRGRALYQLERFDDAAEAFAAVCRVAPDHAGAHGERGRALGAAGKPQAALVELETSLRLSPNDTVYRFLHALTLAELGRATERERELAALIRRGERWREIHDAHAKVLRALGRVADADAAERAARDAEPLEQ
ncbi:MAG: tetratricopeptide repeat protein [Planctomycetes bacterium]|nr:tetratricopeptide repeat protein [Planctomycetota bacterium]